LAVLQEFDDYNLTSVMVVQEVLHLTYVSQGDVITKRLDQLNEFRAGHVTRLVDIQNTHQLLDRELLTLECVTHIS
jgi:hypothetical protein